MTVTGHAPRAPELYYDPYAFEIHDDPYDVYRRLRDEAPAYWNPDLRFWALSRFGDVLQAFRDAETFSSAGGVALENRRRIEQVNPDFRQMIELDPPAHTVLRSLVSRIFTPRRVAAMEHEIRGIFNGYMDAVIEAGHCDLVTEISSPFPMDVISAVLGIPPADRGRLREQASRVMIREDGSMSIPAEAADGMFGLLEYFSADLVDRRSGRGSGLISDLVAIEIDGRKLSDPEMLGFCVLFVIAGHETTTNMVANAVELLSRHRDQRDAIAADLDLVPGAVEEVLRFHNSTQYMHRTLTRDIEMHGRKLPAGDSVLLLIGAANHDPREFGASAEKFDIKRRPERHLAFGYGPHFCLGAALARMEGTIALQEIHRRMPDYVTGPGARRLHSSNVTGWRCLPLSFTPGVRSSTAVKPPQQDSR